MAKGKKYHKPKHMLSMRCRRRRVLITILEEWGMNLTLGIGIRSLAFLRSRHSICPLC
jgi:hypothetical protein